MIQSSFVNLNDSMERFYPKEKKLWFVTDCKVIGIGEAKGSNRTGFPGTIFAFSAC